MEQITIGTVTINLEEDNSLQKMALPILKAKVESNMGIDKTFYFETRGMIETMYRMKLISAYESDCIDFELKAKCDVHNDISNIHNAMENFSPLGFSELIQYLHKQEVCADDEYCMDISDLAIEWREYNLEEFNEEIVVPMTGQTIQERWKDCRNNIDDMSMFDVCEYFLEGHGIGGFTFYDGISADEEDGILLMIDKNTLPSQYR